MRRMTTALAMGLLLIGGCPSGQTDDNGTAGDKLLIFHNNRGPMCLEALGWLDSIQSQYPDLVVEEHLVDQPGETLLLAQLRVGYDQSQGVSTTFGYYPIIFYRNQAFSGFDDQVAEALGALVESTFPPSG